MPSIGAANAMIVARRIENGIKREFSEEVQADARKLFRLVERGGSKFYSTLFLFLGVAFAALTALADIRLAVGILLIGYLCARFAKMLRLDAQREQRELIVSNPAYWGPISEKLKKIVLEAGRMDDPFFRSQVTTIVNDVREN